MKTCSKCGEQFEETGEFFSSRKHAGDRTDRYFVSFCRKCEYKSRSGWREKNRESIKGYQRKYRSANRDKLLQYGKDYHLLNKEICCKRASDWQKNNPEKYRIQVVRLTYGLAPELLMEMMNTQRGCCKICKESLVHPESKYTYNIDHNHETGRVRGLLCHKCNTSLGLLKENITTLLGMVSYLEGDKESSLD